ncbi:hypothetical protein [Rhodococcus marinonascens]|uniref:hypothetical protein n=1 Tax=Rhodococcus marinonascens TaxID=38311 RepID=UPI0009321EB6|nr:hypothetical protein [Rhodococcus marinonascens]
MKKSVRTAAIALAVSPILGLVIAAPASAAITNIADPIPAEDLLVGSMEFGELVFGAVNGGVDFGSLGTGSDGSDDGSDAGSGSSTGSVSSED